MLKTDIIILWKSAYNTYTMGYEEFFTENRIMIVLFEGYWLVICSYKLCLILSWLYDVHPYHLIIIIGQQGFRPGGGGGGLGGPDPLLSAPEITSTIFISTNHKFDIKTYKTIWA